MTWSCPNTVISADEATARRSVANGALAAGGNLAYHGPGSTLGAGINLAAGGAEVTVVDMRPLVVRFQPPAHPLFL